MWKYEVCERLITDIFPVWVCHRHVGWAIDEKLYAFWNSRQPSVLCLGIFVDEHPLFFYATTSGILYWTHAMKKIDLVMSGISASDFSVSRSRIKKSPDCS